MLTLFLLLAGGAEAAPAPASHPLRLTESLSAPTGQDAPAETPEEPKEPEWTGSVTVGAKVTTGNSETRGANATADAELRREDDRISLGFLWLFDENSNNDTDTWTLTDRKTTGKAQYDYFFSKKTYAYVKGQWENDHTAALDLRQTYSVGLGRQIREDEKFKLGTELGVAWVEEDFQGSVDDKEYPAARVAYNLDWAISKSWSLAQNAEAYPSLEDSDDIYTKLDTRLKAAFGESMFGQLQWLYDWNNSPATGKERSDHQLLLSIGWKI
jgi:putative salt-induced outer membrane protein YdiY